MLRLPDSWVWDFWLVDDGASYHVFFLYASRALHDPDARHRRASIGHAVSADLVSWTRVADALVRSDAPAFDDLATWTGSVVRHPDGRWFMFYTGATSGRSGEVVQTIGYATSTDLSSWDKRGEPVLAADPRWYEKYTSESSAHWHEEAFRDPWVFPDSDGNGWHMLITARSNRGPARDPSDTLDRAVVGYAWSPDLEEWELRPPRTAAGSGFGELEVFQTAVVSGRSVLTFSCRAAHTTAAVRATGTTGGIWVTRIPSPLGPFDIAGAQLLMDDRFYVGKFIDDRDTGQTCFLAAINMVDGRFVGELCDPFLVSWNDDQLTLCPVDHRGAVPARRHSVGVDVSL